MLKCLTAATALLCTAVHPAHAQAPVRAPIDIPRLSEAIEFDGNPFEQAWQRIPILPLTQYAPRYQAPPSFRSEIRVAYDAEFFYVSGRFYDHDRSGIRVNSLYRDRWNGDDALAIYIDAFNDNQNAKWFGVNPAGMRFDVLVSGDGSSLNNSWDTFWNAKSVVTDSGWFTEVRIPLSSIGFKVGPNGEASMGLTVTRLVSRTGERVTFPDIDPKFEFRQPSVAQDVVLRDVHTRTPLYVTPYLLQGNSRASTFSPANGAFFNSRMQREAGLDVRYPLSAQLTLDVTANTDFAQVEADDQVVNLDRFPLFFPERRRFFQEGSGIFDFSTGGGSQLFHSRRIGLANDFTPVPVIGGARLVGRVGSWDVGILDMQTERVGLEAGANYGVLRLRRPVVNQWSTAGVMATSVMSGARHNQLVAGDMIVRVGGDHFVTGKVASSFDARDSTATATSRSLFDARLERRVQRGVSYSATVTHAGRDYQPDLGFLPRRNFTTANIVSNWFLFPRNSRLFRRVYPGALAFSTFRNADHALESGQYAVWVQWDTPTGGGGWIEPKYFRENVNVAFKAGDVIDIPVGVYDFADLQLVLSMASGRRLRAAVDARAGTYFDGQRAQVVFTPTWNASRHLEIGGDYQFTRLRFPVRDQAADIQLVRLRLRGALDVQKSVQALVQYNSTRHRIDFNARLRYAFSEGRDLWVVYNEGMDTDRWSDANGLVSPRLLSRALIVKYTHTFTL